MQQNIPLDYPKIIKKYMEQHVSGYRDTVVYNDMEYKIEPLGDDFEIMRLHNTVTNAVFNITEHDHSLTYKNMSEVMGLLRTIESLVVFTPMDWVNHFTQSLPVYHGNSLSVYRECDNDLTVVELHTGKDNTFTIDKHGNLKITGRLSQVHSRVDGNVNIGITVEDNQKVDDYINDVPELVDDWLDYAFNNEHLLTNANNMHVQHDNTDAINEGVWVTGPVVRIGDMLVNVNSDERTLTWTVDDHDYHVTETGVWDKRKVEPKRVKPEVAADTAFMYSTSFMYITIKESSEHGFALALVKLLNNLAKGGSLEALDAR